MMTPKARLRPVLVPIAYLAMTLVMTYPLLFHLADTIPGDGFDGWQNYWNLWWVKQALVDLGTNPYFTSYLDYPSGVSLYFHTLNIFNGLWTLPIQLVGSLLLAYNAVVLFSFAIAGYGVYLLTRYILRNTAPTSPWPAWVAGIIFTFSPFHFAHLLGHTQVFSLEWIPFYILYLLKTVDAGQARGTLWRHALLAALFLALTGLCDWYYILYLVLFTALYLLYAVLTRLLTRRSLGALACIGVATGIILSPLWIPMVREASRATYMVPDPSHALRLSADLLAFVTPNEMHPLWGPAARAWSEHFTTTTSERMVFAGYLPLFLALFALWRGRSRIVTLWTLSLGFFLVLSLGPTLHIGGETVFTSLGLTVPLPYRWLAQAVPYMNITRSVSRFDVMVMLSLGILAAVGLLYPMRAAERHGKWATTGLGLLVTAVICFEFLAVPYPLTPPDTPSFYRTLASDGADYAILNLPMDWDRPNYLLYQTVHGKRLTSAYTSRDNPLSLVDRTPVLQDFRHPGPHVVQGDPTEVGLAVLNAFGVRYVVLDNYQMPDETQRQANLSLASRVFGSQSPIYKDERLTVYQVADKGKRNPFVRLGAGWSREQIVRGQPLRSAPGQADVVIYSPSVQEVQIKMALRSASGPFRVTLSTGTDMVGTYDLFPDTPTEIQNTLRVSPGETIVHVKREGSTRVPDMLELTSLSLASQ